MHDRDTRLLGAIPTAQKGGKYLQYVITEFVRFIMHTQHKEVALRSDPEPTNLAILDGVRKTCRGLGITLSLFGTKMVTLFGRWNKRLLLAKVLVGTNRYGAVNFLNYKQFCRLHCPPFSFIWFPPLL
jgi:hypothetical protein